MDGCGSCEQNSLLSELKHGMELAKQLKAHLGPEFPSETKGMLVEKILSSYEKALFMLKWNGSMERPHQSHVVPSAATPRSPVPIAGSPFSEDCNAGFSGQQQDSKDLSKKRKMMDIWREQVKVSNDSGLEGPPDDGFSWRKYGQKDILGALYPRSYYRCTYRNSKGCWATKHVQRSDEDPATFDITYKGKHTCNLTIKPPSALSSPQKQESEQNYVPTMEFQHQSPMTMNFDTGLRVDVQNLDTQEMTFPVSSMALGSENYTVSPASTMLNKNHFNNYSPFVSPTTFESNYFSVSPYNVNTSGGLQNPHHSDTDIAEIISAATSATNSPIIGPNFSTDSLQFSTFFPYDNSRFCP